MQEYDIGIFGMGVMGSNLALNIADHGFQAAVYNITPDLTQKMIEMHPHKNIKGFFDLSAFVASLARPRKILMMIPAGKPVDDVIESLSGLLEQGDCLIDGGNSYFKDTIRREHTLKRLGIHYFGMGVSGGETGARKGPALMPGGNKDAYEEIRPIVEAIAARAADGKSCCRYIGADGAGHYVKMVHNGIEYADMQLIAESYLLLKYLGKKTNEELSDIYRAWNEGELNSFLIRITADIFREREQEGFLIDKIVDSAGQKGTGRWTSVEALEEGVNTSIITAACNARVISNLLTERERYAKKIQAPVMPVPEDDFVEDVQRSLYTAKIIAYTQGFSLYRSAGKWYHWDLDLGGIASLFRGGCIIQARFLDKITEAYRKNPDLEALMEDSFFLEKINDNLQSLRRVVSLAASSGLPVPAMMNALAFIDASRSQSLGANLIQAQRDYFGAHTFCRVDREGTFHHEWQHHDGSVQHDG